MAAKANASGNKVSLTDSGFSPASVTIAKGTPVIFKNDTQAVAKICFDEAQHGNSGDLSPGAEWTTHTFDAAGTFGLHHDGCPHKVSVVVS